MQFLLPATCKHHLWTLARLSRGDGLVPHKPWPGAKSWRGHGICALKGWRRLKSTAHILRVFFFLGRQRERPCTEEAPRSRLRLPASWACNQTSCARLSTSCRSRSSRATIRCPIWPCTDQGSYCYEPWNSCTARGMAARYSSSSCVAPLLLLLLLLPTAVPFSAVAPVMKLRCEWVGGSWGCRHARAHSIATPGVCALTAMADFEVGDRVKFLVKTVSFSRKVTSNGMTSTDLTGVPPPMQNITRERCAPTVFEPSVHPRLKHSSSSRASAHCSDDHATLRHHQTHVEPGRSWYYF